MQIYIWARAVVGQGELSHMAQKWLQLRATSTQGRGSRYGIYTSRASEAV